MREGYPPNDTLVPWFDPSSSQVPESPGEWLPGPGFGGAESRATARRAALDAVAAIRTIEAEEDGPPT